MLVTRSLAPAMVRQRGGYLEVLCLLAEVMRFARAGLAPM